MKKVIYSLLLVFAAVFIACEEELPKANFDLYELKSLEATAGDMSVMLAWEDYENARPSEYLVVWDAGNAGSDGGQMTVEAGKKSVVVENLENDMTYSFSVQPRYANGLAGKTSVKSTPKNARYPVTDLSATAGSERVRLSWTKPNSERFTNYQITVNPGGKVITLDDTSLEFYVVDGLVNDTEYTFSMIASYPTGNSEVVEASATPGKLSPILIDQSDKTELILWESATFTLNDMFFMGGDVQSVSWDFGDGTISTELSPQHAYGTVKDKYTVSVTVTYTNGTADTGSMDVAVVNYKWNSIKLQSGNYTGYVKVSNPVFSPDGKTMYIPTSTPAGHLFGKNEGYEQQLNNPIAPYFREHPVALCDLTKQDILAFYEKELERVKPTTVKHYHALIHGALNYAVDKNLIPSNPADRIIISKPEPFKGDYYLDSEVLNLFEVIKGHKIELVVLLTAFYGLRRSEVIGLKWSAFDFNHNCFSIRHTVTTCNVKGERVTIKKDKAKNKARLRTYPLIPFLKERLLEAKKQQEENRKLCGRAYNKEYLGYVCVDVIGNLIKPNYVSSTFGKLLAKNYLRHTCASLLLANGVPMEQVKEWLGHSEISTTVDIYGHLQYATKKQSAAAIEQDIVAPMLQNLSAVSP